jgi:hypothetical protein
MNLDEKKKTWSRQNSSVNSWEDLLRCWPLESFLLFEKRFILCCCLKLAKRGILPATDECLYWLFRNFSEKMISDAQHGF